jgi:hypothetical protein
LLAAFRHAGRPDVRKAAVLALAALWRVAGESALSPALATLTTPQLRLLGVYCERIGGGGGGVQAAAGAGARKGGGGEAPGDARPLADAA